MPTASRSRAAEKRNPLPSVGELLNRIATNLPCPGPHDDISAVGPNLRRGVFCFLILEESSLSKHPRLPGVPGPVKGNYLQENLANGVGECIRLKPSHRAIANFVIGCNTSAHPILDVGKGYQINMHVRGKRKGFRKALPGERAKKWLSCSF